MPTGKNWLNYIYINLGFVAQVLVMYYFTALIEIQKNWPEYRCNPIYMPLSNDITSDFTYCIQNTQINLMGYLLQPFTYLISSLSSAGGGFLDNLDGIRNMTSGIITFVSNIVENIFGVFSNIIIQFQVIMIGLKDIVGKVIGIMVTLMYILDGSNKTMQSAWKGPPGQLVQALGACFHPETNIKLKNGNIYMIQNIPLGSILENGSKVFAVMKIDNPNPKKEYLYKIKGGVNGEDIYVTGTHFIQDKNTSTFIQVKKCEYAIKQTDISSSWYSCLITDDNKIPIGEHIFWDWEDDCLFYSR